MQRHLWTETIQGERGTVFLWTQIFRMHLPCQKLCNLLLINLEHLKKDRKICNNQTCGLQLQELTLVQKTLWNLSLENKLASLELPGGPPKVRQNLTTPNFPQLSRVRKDVKIKMSSLKEQ